MNSNAKQPETTESDIFEQLLADCNRALESLKLAAQGATQCSSNGRVVIGGSSIIRGVIGDSSKSRFIQSCLKELDLAKASDRTEPGSKTWWWIIKDTTVKPDALRKVLENSNGRIFSSRNKPNDPYGLADRYHKTMNGPVTVMTVAEKQEAHPRRGQRTSSARKRRAQSGIDQERRGHRRERSDHRQSPRRAERDPR